MEHPDVAARVAALESQLASLTQELAERPDATASRRDVFKKLAIAGAGAAVGAVALSKPAGADSGTGLVIGQSQSAQNTTRLYNGPAAANFAGAPLTDGTPLFWADNRGSALVSPDGDAIQGDGHGSGIGVHGRGDVEGVGIRGDGGIGVWGFGTRAALQLGDTGTAPPTRTDAHVKGELTTDANGDLWFCVADGTPGTWRQLSGPTTAGQLHLLVAPARVYDSRPGATNDGPLSGGATRVVSLAGTMAVPGVPAGAGGALVSLTLDATVSSGFLALFSNAVTYQGNSNVNWYTNGQILAVTTVTAVDATGKVKVLAGGPGSTQFIIDVIGYYE
jgi:hypothetical protein